MGCLEAVTGANQKTHTNTECNAAHTDSERKECSLVDHTYNVFYVNYYEIKCFKTFKVKSLLYLSF